MADFNQTTHCQMNTYTQKQEDAAMRRQPGRQSPELTALDSEWGAFFSTVMTDSDSPPRPCREGMLLMRTLRYPGGHHWPHVTDEITEVPTGRVKDFPELTQLTGGGPEI